jgi:hypothetical protein
VPEDQVHAIVQRSLIGDIIRPALALIRSHQDWMGAFEMIVIAANYAVTAENGGSFADVKLLDVLEHEHQHYRQLWMHSS